ncbi:ABC transporter permease [Desulfosporosinus sp. SB140]|uniref:ABC transporter permease n=1 Tax=Desulfosporosinus paludis TaxID=3115649 RepID=UPI00389063E4
MKEKGYTATGKLLKLYLRNNKVITLLLIFLPFLFAYAAAASNMAVLRTPEQLSTYIAENQGNLLQGIIAANTIAAVTIWRIRLSTAIIMSILSIVLMINNTRKDEELGRLELLRAGAVGPEAPLTAALIKVLGANLLGGLMMDIGFIAAGFPATGSFAAGLSTALCVCSFIAMAAIAAQAAPNASLARGFSFGAIAFFFVFQIIANAAGNERLLLWTPFGWCAYARPFAGENFLLFAFAIPVIALLVVIAYSLSDRRDMGSSYLRERHGRVYAQEGFNSPLALAWRLQRSMLIVWVAAYALMGMIMASLIPSINKMFAGTDFLPELSAVLGGAGRAFLAILAYILTQVLTAYVIMAVLRIREEEAMNRAELVLSSAASRLRYAAGYVLIAFAGSAAALAIFGFFTGDFASSMARLPAVWLIASVTVLIYGWIPRAAAPVGWGLFGVSLLLEFLWEIRVIGNPVFRLSPFSWVYPGVTVSFTPIFTMLLLAGLLVSLGLISFSRRDMITE